MKIYISTLGFVRADILEYSMRHLYDDKFLSVEADHYFLYQHYPLRKEENRKKLEEICQRYGIKWVDSGMDRGAHHGFNYLCSQLPLADDDIIIGFDPDEYPSATGWDKALVDVLLEDPTLAYVILDNKYNILNSDGALFLAKEIAGYRVLIPTNRPTMMGVCAMRWSWLKQIGGYHQPATHYGHLESHLWGKLQETGKSYGILADFRQIYGLVPPHDPEYIQYKQEQAGFVSKEGMAEWLVKKGLQCS